MNKFLQKFKVTEKVENKHIDVNSYFNKDEFPFVKKIVDDFGGCIFNKGLFKIHTFEYVHKWTNLLKEFFKEEMPDFNLLCFATNWQGNMYCINSSNSEIVYFDPATCEFFEAEFSIDEFFNSVLVDGEYDIIFEEYFEEAQAYLKFDFIPYDKSLGHKIYLHLGGREVVQNLEIVDTEVLWELQIQTANRINEIPD